MSGETLWRVKTLSLHLSLQYLQNKLNRRRKVFHYVAIACYVIIGIDNCELVIKLLHFLLLNSTKLYQVLFYFYLFTSYNSVRDVEFISNIQWRWWCYYYSASTLSHFHATRHFHQCRDSWESHWWVRIRQHLPDSQQPPVHGLVGIALVCKLL